jgi:mannose-6-phosphate isomerase-like protein (cupin superfamily)
VTSHVRVVVASPRPSRLREEEAPKWVVLAPGVRSRPLVEGGGTALLLYQVESGVRLETHIHDYSEFGVMISGEAHIDIGEEERDLREGDSFYIPPRCPHGFSVRPGKGPAVVLDVSVTSVTEPAPIVPVLLRQVQEIVTRAAD